MNIHDLAHHLNISIGTVSRALNGRAGVNAKTRQRVLEGAKKLGYSPNQSGRSLRQGTTGLVGFMIITNRERVAKGEAFFMSVLDGLQSYLGPRGRELVVHLCGSDQDPEAHLRHLVERRLVDGIIISQMQRVDKRIEYLIEQKMPFIAFGRSQSVGKYSWLDLDFEGVADRAINHLVSLGHRRIAIASDSNDINFGYVFVDACRSSLARHGIELADNYILREPLTESGGYRVGERLLSLVDRPTAIVLVENTMVIGLYHKLQDAKMIPGRDIAVVGFHNSPNGEFLRPTLTQFQLSLHDLGGWLGEHMVTLLEAKAASKRIKHASKIWPMELIIGESSGSAVPPSPHD